MRELLPNAEVTLVDEEVDAAIVLYIYPSKEPVKITIPLPQEAFEFILKFDNPIEWANIESTLHNEMVMEARANMSELSFEIDIPEEVINYIGIKQVNEILSKSETLSYDIRG